MCLCKYCHCTTDSHSHTCRYLKPISLFLSWGFHFTRCKHLASYYSVLHYRWTCPRQTDQWLISSDQQPVTTTTSTKLHQCALFVYNLSDSSLHCRLCNQQACLRTAHSSSSILDHQHSKCSLSSRQPEVPSKCAKTLPSLYSDPSLMFGFFTATKTVLTDRLYSSVPFSRPSWHSVSIPEHFSKQSCRATVRLLTHFLSSARCSCLF